MSNARIVITRRGGPEVLELIETPLPRPRAHEVRVRVLAAGVAYADILMRQGAYPGAPRVPFTPGYDVVGVVDAVGQHVTTVQTGQMVAALTTTGGYARFVCLPEHELVTVPDHVDPALTVAAMLNFVTAYQLLHREAHVRGGERVLVHGAAGGVGSALLELGRLARLEVYATASTDKHDLVRTLGAAPIDYRRQDFVTHLRGLVPSGVDVVFDGVGGRSFERSYHVLAERGRLIAYGVGPAVTNSRFARLGLLDSVLRLARLKFRPDDRFVTFYLINAVKRRHPAWFREDLQAVLAHLAQGRIAPVVSAQFPLEHAAKAHEMLEGFQGRGKIVLLPQA